MRCDGASLSSGAVFASSTSSVCSALGGVGKGVSRQSFAACLDVMSSIVAVAVSLCISLRSCCMIDGTCGRVGCSRGVASLLLVADICASHDSDVAFVKDQAV